MSEEVATATHDLFYWQRRAQAAEQRERVASDAYNQQQSSYRELETLYQASQERALRAEADAAALHQASQERALRAEADAAALHQALNVLIAGIKDHARKDLDGYQLITNTAAVFARSTLDFRPSGAALLAELAAARKVVEAADNDEWHSSKDCKVEERAHECALCVALTVYRAKAGQQ